MSIRKACVNFLIKGESKDTKTKLTKRNIANTYTILPSMGLDQELHAGQHMTIADCLVDYSKLKKTKEY